MATFSTYASKFLNQSLQPTNEPLFYSIAEGSHDGELDEDDPHLRPSRGIAPAEDYDPFNLEDITDAEHEESEPEEALDDAPGDAQDSLPLLLQSNWRQNKTSPISNMNRVPLSPSPSSSTDSIPLGLDMLEEDRPARPAQTLTESLLPRDPQVRGIFSLPHPGRASRRKYNDQAWATLWFIALGICGIGSILTLFVTSVR